MVTLPDSTASDEEVQVSVVGDALESQGARYLEPEPAWDVPRSPPSARAQFGALLYKRKVHVGVCLCIFLCVCVSMFPCVHDRPPYTP
jgi:hypothetical protein